MKKLFLLVLLFTVSQLIVLQAVFATPGEWKSKWEDTKKDYEEIAKKKKPSEKFLGTFSKSSGLESALKKLDGAYAAYKKEMSAKHGEVYNEALRDYVETRDGYLGLLQKAMEKNDGDAAALDILKKGLAFIETEATAQGKNLSAKAGNAEDATDKAPKKKEKLTNPALGNLESTVKDIELAIAKWKAKPDTFDVQQMQDITNRLKAAFDRAAMTWDTLKKPDPKTLLAKVDKLADDPPASMKSLAKLENTLKEINTWIEADTDWQSVEPRTDQKPKKDFLKQRNQ